MIMLMKVGFKHWN